VNRKITLAALAVTLGVGALGATAPAFSQEPARRGGGQLFQQADTNNDGRVTADEAWTGLSARFAAADANKDGGVSWEEFHSYAQGQMASRRGDRPAPPAGRLARMEQRSQGFFRAIDADREGKVTLTELRPFADAMFRARDANADNALSRDEIRPQHARGHRPARTQQQQPAQQQ
jgi:hypothetical protein